MKCKHCGKELIAVTMYMEAPNVAANAPAAVMPIQPSAPVRFGEFLYFPCAAAALAYLPGMIPCAHEPEAAYPNTAAGVAP